MIQLHHYTRIGFLALLLTNQTVLANNMYKWVDEKGNTFFADQVPPEKSGYERELLNKGGRVVEVIEKEKTKEQLELENRLTQLRKEQAKIIASQKARDNALLNTFHSKEDMELAFNVKIQTMNSQRKVLETQLDHLSGQLQQQQAQAAEMERNAQPVSEKLLKDMATTQQQIKQSIDAITASDEKKKQATDEFHADLDRFLFLMQKSTNSPSESKVASIKEANELGLFFCENDKQCNKVWEIARNFINQYSTTPADIYNDKLIMNRAPATDSDLSLSLSKIAIDDDNYELFLDIRCRDSVSGRELCASEKAQSIRAAFRPYINDALTRAATQ
ncbi:MAG: DUF4124 domain-containing protein, partial [Methylococcaceae bacterium]